MTLPTTQLSLWQVACTVGEVSNGKLVTNLSKLCASDNINIWSRYKPLRASAPTLNSTLRETLTGFKINSSTMYLEWDKPTGGQSSPYRLGDFRGYKPDAKLPSCKDLYIDLYVENDSQINNYREFSFNYTLPEADTILAMANDNQLGNLDTIAFAKPDGTLFGGYCGSSESNSINNKCCAKLSDLAIGGSVSTISANIKLTSLRYDYGITYIGQKYKIEIVPWLGSSTLGDYKKAKIPGGDLVTIQGTIVSTVYVINLDAMSGPYPPNGIDRGNSIVQSTSNTPSSSTATDGSLVVDNVQITGPIRSETTSQQVSDFINFQKSGSFRIQMIIYDKGLAMVRTVDNLLTTYPALKSGVSVQVDLSTQTYKVVIYNSFTISNLGKGYSILFRLNPD